MDILQEEQYQEKRKKQIDTTFLKIAKNISELSHCNRAKVGALVVNTEKNIIGYGFNGTPSGFDNNAEILVDGKLVTKAETLHAESNAIAKIAKSTFSSDGSTMYITLSPCYDCAKLIVQAGIKRVVFCEFYRNTEALELLSLAKIEVDYLDLEKTH